MGAVLQVTAPPRLREIARLRARIERDRQALLTAIVDAYQHREGFTVKEVAEAAGVTRERVYQIVKEQQA